MEDWVQAFRQDVISIENEIAAADLYASCPESILEFVLCLEDRRFFSHPGFDPLSIGRVLLKNIFGKRAGGASTIEQQFVRTVTNRRERSLKRKIREIALAAYISRRHDKKKILNVYMNIAYLGHGIKGAEVASLRVFKKPIQNLSDYESAIIASLLLYPYPKYPSPNWEQRIFRRADYAIKISKKISEKIKSRLRGSAPLSQTELPPKVTN